MSDYQIPDDVRRFVASSIDSVPQMEALLLLRSNPREAWTVEEVARRLYVDPRTALTVLGSLRALGFLGASEDKNPRYQYQPTTPELASMADNLADAYSNALIPVTTLIHSKPRSRIQQFADSFKWRKDS